jgi:hypothetical protein
MASVLFWTDPAWEFAVHVRCDGRSTSANRKFPSIRGICDPHHTIHVMAGTEALP